MLTSNNRFFLKVIINIIWILRESFPWSKLNKTLYKLREIFKLLKRNNEINFFPQETKLEIKENEPPGTVLSKYIVYDEDSNPDIEFSLEFDDSQPNEVKT